MAKSDNKSFIPNLVQGGDSVFENLTVRGSLTLSGDNKLILNNKKGKDLILKCNDAGNLDVNATGTFTGTFSSTNTGTIKAPGMTLQTSYFEEDQLFNNTAIRLYEVINSGIVTSLGANSRYLVMGYAHAYSPTEASRCNIGFSVTIGSSTYRIAGIDGASGDSWGTSTHGIGATYARQSVWNPSVAGITVPAGTTMTFNLLGASFDVIPNWNWSIYGHKNTLTVQEIAT